MRGADIAATALSMAMLVGAGGCTRTSDGSIEMMRPSLTGLFDDDEPAVIVPSRTLTRPVTQPVPTRLAGTRPRLIPPKVSVPTMKIANNPPLQPADPAKPLSCKNSRTATGRIQVICA
jgi:hypothetical protein